MNIVITGHTGIIGSLIAKHCMVKGHTVTGISRRGKTGSQVSQYLKADVGDYRDMAKAAIQVKSADALITCAAMQGPIGAATTNDPVIWGDTITTNLIGTYNAIRAFWGLLQKSDHPRIICLSGGGAANARPNFSAYAASKTAVVRLVETIAEELARQATINAVAPGAFYSEMTKQVLAAGSGKAGSNEYEQAQAIKQSPSENTQLLELIDYLLSAESSGLTGRLISAKWDGSRYREYMGEDTFKLRRMTE